MQDSSVRGVGRFWMKSSLSGHCGDQTPLSAHLDLLTLTIGSKVLAPYHGSILGML
ncbi:MAG: hypothetical protein ACI97A_004029 [Planctomycetota bacterium]|jgi:hypothetical protein